MLSSIALILLGGCGMCAFALYAWTTSQSRRVHALRTRVLELSTTSSEIGGALLGTARSDRPGPTTPGARFIGSLLPGSEVERRRIELRLRQAGLASPEALTRFFMARLVGLGMPFAAVFCCGYARLIPLDRAMFGAVAAGLLGWLSPMIWLDRRVANRRRQLRLALPDFIDLMIVCMESGLSVPAALQRVTEEIHLAHPLLAEELEVIQRDTSLGAQLDAAFLRFAERSGLDIVRTLATFVRESRRFGSQIADALRSHAESMRFEREQVAEENAQKASVKILFPMLILILPAVFVVLAGPAVIQIQSAFSK